MKEERKFLRKCIGCGKYERKENLIKITKQNGTDEIFVNPKSNIYGRSCYICKNAECINSAFKKMKISKILKKNVPENLKQKIITVLESRIVLQIY